MPQPDLLRTTLYQWAERPLNGAALRLHRLHVRPDHVTWTGAGLAVLAAAILVLGHPRAAGAVFLAGSALDMLDGALARVGGGQSRFGAFLDSTLDRVGEGALLAAIAYRFADQGWPAGAALVVIALLLAVLVSYTRARAEGLGIRCEVGLLTRPERVVVLSLGLLLVRPDIAVYVLVALGGVTVVQRMRHVRRQLD